MKLHRPNFFSSAHVRASLEPKLESLHRNIKGIRRLAAKNTKAVLGIVVMIIPIFAALVMLGQKTIFRSKATSDVFMVIDPNIMTSPPDQETYFWANLGDNRVAFINAEIKFDPKLIQLTKEIKYDLSLVDDTGLHMIPQDHKFNIVRQTNMQEANSTGVINISIGLKPEYKDHPMMGNFQIATLNLTATDALTDSTQLVIDRQTLQIVDLDGNELTVNIPADATVNSSAANSAPYFKTDSSVPIEIKQGKAYRNEHRIKAWDNDVEDKLNIFRLYHNAIETIPEGLTIRCKKLNTAQASKGIISRACFLMGKTNSPAGDYPITLRAMDDKGAHDTQVFTIRVMKPDASSSNRWWRR